MSQDLSGDDDIGNIPLSDNENPRSDNEKDADNETGTREIVDPLKKRIIRKPQPKLNAEKLRNKKGVQTIEEYFQGFKWRGKGYEASDLNKVMKRLEHWGHRLFPKYNFDDLLEKLENLGSKKEVQVFLIKYRKDMLTDDLIGENNPDDENDVRKGNSPEPVDEFDLLIAEQIEKTKQINTPIRDEGNSSTFSDNTHKNLNESIKKTSPAVIIDDEMRKRIERNRQIALEKKMARMKATQEAEALSRKEAETTPNIPSKESIPNENAISATVDDLSQSMELTDSVEENRQLDLSKILVQAEGTDENTHENNFVENSDDNLLLNDNTGHVENSSVQLDNYDEDVHHDEINLSSSHIENTQKEVNISSGKRLLTNEELDKEIDDAVNQFMKRKRQSK